MEKEKCGKCMYGQAMQKHWKEQYEMKKATIIVKTAAITTMTIAIITRLIILVKK